MAWSSDPGLDRQLRCRVANQLRAARQAQSVDRLHTILAFLESQHDVAQRSSLLPHEWDLYLALQCTVTAGGHAGLGPKDLDRLFDLHRSSILHIKSITLFRRYIGLVLVFFSQISHIDFPFLDTDSDEAEVGSAGTLMDPAHEWTGLQGCPRFYSKSGIYLAESLPSLLSVDDQDGITWEAVCGLDAIRSRVRDAYSRCAFMLQESQSVWQLYISFELAVLASGKLHSDQQVDIVRQIFLARLGIPHAELDQTFQAFSSFVTQHLPSQSYESEMSAANALFSEAKAIYSSREQYEDALARIDLRPLHIPNSRQDLDLYASVWKRYLIWQQGRVNRAIQSKDKSAADIELDLTSSLYERAIARFGLHPPATQREEIYAYAQSSAALEEYGHQWKRLSSQEREARAQSEQQLLSERMTIAENLWSDYVTTLTSGSRPNASLTLEVCSRSVRVLPTSVRLYAAFLRQLARFRRPKSQIEELFERAASPGAIDLKGSDLADLCLARLDCERDLATYQLTIRSGSAHDIDPATDMDKFSEIFALISYSLGKLAELPSAADYDQSLRLEKFAVNWVERAINALGGPNSDAGAGLNELAEGVWQTCSSQQPDNALVYREAASYWTRRYEPRKARSWYKAGVTKLECNHAARASGETDASQYEALLQDWMQFEHQYGSIGDLEHIVGKIRSERRRMWDAWYEASQAYSFQLEQQQYNASGTDATNPNGVSGHRSSSAATVSANAGVSIGKRKASDAGESTDVNMADRYTDNDYAATTKGEDDGEQLKLSAESDKAPTRDREHFANMPPETDAAALRSFLRGCGRIVELAGPSSLTNPNYGKSASAALVEFADASGATSAKTRHGKTLRDHQVSVHIGWQCTVFVTNFPEEWEDADIRRAFGVYGTVFNVRWPSKRFVTTRRFCYVQFTDPEAARSSLALDKREVTPDRTLTVALSDPSRRKQRTDAQENTRELFVSGLPRNITEDQLKFGPVTGLRGLGFVDFEKTLDAQQALRELNSTKFRGKTISVTIAEHRSVHGAVKSNYGSSSSTHIRQAAGGSRDTQIESAAAKAAERRSRSVKVFDLPGDAQEALIQQALEHAMGRDTVRAVLWTPGSDKPWATAEFKDQATAGKAILRQDIRYANDLPLRLESVDQPGTSAQSGLSSTVSTASATGLVNNSGLVFIPRTSRGRGRVRGRGALGFVRSRPQAPMTDDGEAPMDEETLPSTPSADSQSRGQDHFREMLKRTSE
ncbi:hypothetical protein BCV70DRAFT_210771 [Testicularia cyperi]|uniref:U4/U6 snRNA-associated-splicing factor PRP24 n=1 Tax=Testicularia cyperi TaxID=1882483 RepID=A0A317XW66_9BASI|nr:hypothetical protein BCV70DRAFT_210771 [Testicularia cyperi]